MADVKILPEVPESVDNALKNLTDAPTKSVGETLGDIWSLVLGARINFARQKQDLKYAVAMEKFKSELHASVEKIPEANRVNPDFQTVSQALEDSKYCVENDDLRSMFANLITSSMDGRKSSTAHPSFSGIIKQLSPEDASLFQGLYVSVHTDNIPMIKVEAAIQGTNNYYPEYFPKWFFSSLRESVDMFQISRSLENLHRLNLMALMYDRSILGSGKYDTVKNDPVIQKQFELAKHQHPDINLHLKIVECAGFITDFGSSFAKCCF